MKIEIAGIYWPEANVGNFSFISFLLVYLRFSEVEFFKFYYQDKTIIVKNCFLKISVYGKRPPLLAPSRILVPNSQLATIFLANSQLTTNFG